MAKQVVGLFDSMQDAQGAVQELRNANFSPSDISLVANNARGEYSTSDGSGSEAAEGAGAGATGGAVLGGLGGLLVGLGALAIPGIGPVVAAGTLATALGTTALGAGIGAAAGGLVGALVGAGIPEEDANVYAEGVRRGGALVTVQASTDADADRAADILDRYNVVDIDERSANFRSGGWDGFDSNTGEYDRSTSGSSMGGGAMSTAGSGRTDAIASDRSMGADDSGRSEWAESSKVGTAGGTLAGAATGAAIGSVGGPVGTVIGGIAGAVTGGGVGAAGDAAGEAASDSATGEDDLNRRGTRDMSSGDYTSTSAMGTGAAMGSATDYNTSGTMSGSSMSTADRDYTMSDDSMSPVDRDRSMSDGMGTADSDRSEWAESSKVGTAGGTLAGAATGAAIGSVGGPVGTVVGGIAGAVTGGGVGAAGDAAGEAASDSATGEDDLNRRGTSSGGYTSSGAMGTGAAIGSATDYGTSGSMSGSTTGTTGYTDTTMQSGTRDINTDQDSATIPVIEEEIRVGKREVESGGVRVETRVTETPVNEQVTLREERVNVERRTVDQPVDAGTMTDAFREGTFEVRERGEEAVVSKEARVVEEVVINKDVDQRTETIQDTVRRTDVDVEEIPGQTRSTGYTETSGTSTSGLSGMSGTSSGMSGTSSGLSDTSSGMSRSTGDEGANEGFLSRAGNALERGTGRDLDRDGDVGRPDPRNNT